jgi:Putative mono-oxygenase ydhR
MITAIVLYRLPSLIGYEECRAHFIAIAPDFLRVPGFLRKHFIYSVAGGVAGGTYLWESLEAAQRFYNGPWLEGIRRRYGADPQITYYETFAIADALAAKAGPADAFLDSHAGHVVA